MKVHPTSAEIFQSGPNRQIVSLEMLINHLESYPSIISRLDSSDETRLDFSLYTHTHHLSGQTNQIEGRGDTDYPCTLTSHPSLSCPPLPHCWETEEERRMRKGGGQRRHRSLSLLFPYVGTLLTRSTRVKNDLFPTARRTYFS